MNICTKLKSLKIKFSSFQFFVGIFYFIFILNFIFSFILEGFFLDDLLRGLPRDTKMTTGNGLKVACSNTVLLFFTKVFL